MTAHKKCSLPRVCRRHTYTQRTYTHMAWPPLQSDDQALRRMVHSQTHASTAFALPTKRATVAPSPRPWVQSTSVKQARSQSASQSVNCRPLSLWAWSGVTAKRAMQRSILQLLACKVTCKVEANPRAQVLFCSVHCRPLHQGAGTASTRTHSCWVLKAPAVLCVGTASHKHHLRAAHKHTGHGRPLLRGQQQAGA